MGDVHQPLHVTARMTAFEQKGDAGGNGFCLGKTHPVGAHSCSTNLHEVWDGILDSKRGTAEVAEGNRVDGGRASFSVDVIAADLQARYGKPVFIGLGNDRHRADRQPGANPRDPGTPARPAGHGDGCGKQPTGGHHQHRVAGDGTANRNYSAASLPATRVVNQSGESFYLLQVPFEVRSVQTGSGPVTLAASANGFELKTASPTYTLTATVNGQPATIRSVSGTPQPANTTAYTFNDYTPGTQGQMLRVDLNLNENPYLTWATQYFPNPNAPEAAPGADPDGDGFTNEQ